MHFRASLAFNGLFFAKVLGEETLFVVIRLCKSLHVKFLGV